jgi:class 3 adenylate cyclase
MAVFIGESKNSQAAKAALQINHMVTVEINPRIRKQYPTTSYEIRHAVGIDTSKLFVAKTGVRNANDLVWVGRAANYAAKLCGLRNGSYSSFMTAEVFARLTRASKLGGNPERSMWEAFTWAETGLIAYRSSWQWKPA